MENQRQSKVVMTRHAKKRIKERVGIKNKRGQIDVAQNAFSYGIRYDEAVGTQKKYIESRLKEQPEYADREIRLYRDILFVFLQNMLITVLPPDKTFCKKLQAQRHKKKHNVKTAA